MQPKPISETLRPLAPNCRTFITHLVVLQSDAVSAPRESLWLRHNQKMRKALETLSSKSTKSTLNPCLQTRANNAGVKGRTIGIRSAVQRPFRVKLRSLVVQPGNQLCLRKRTSSGPVGMSQKCHNRTHASQQKLFDPLEAPPLHGARQ